AGIRGVRCDSHPGGWAQNDRLTGNFVSALFTHDTSRALDPHLHTHCIVFNATFDRVEKRWKALQNYDMLRARKYAENVYYHELAKRLRRFGYEIRNKPRGDFEIEGIAPELCERFSILGGRSSLRPPLGSGGVSDLAERLGKASRCRCRDR